VDYTLYDSQPAAAPCQPETSTSSFTTSGITASERKSSRAHLGGRIDSPGPTHLRQPLTSSTPPPGKANPSSQLGQQRASTNLPPVSTPPRSLSPTRKPVPNRGQPLTPAQSRTASPAPPKLPDLGFASPFDPLKDQRLASYQLQEPVKTQSQLFNSQGFQSTDSTGNHTSVTSFGPNIHDISRTATPPVRSDSPASQSSKSTISRPAKGPATFEEMGVPMAKQEQDCVSARYE